MTVILAASLPLKVGLLIAVLLCANRLQRILRQLEFTESRFRERARGPDDVFIETF